MFRGGQQASGIAVTREGLHKDLAILFEVLRIHTPDLGFLSTPKTDLLLKPKTPQNASLLRLARIWCYTCDGSTAHEVRYRSELDFVGKILVCRECGERIKEPLGGSSSRTLSGCGC